MFLTVYEKITCYFKIYKKNKIKKVMYVIIYKKMNYSHNHHIFINLRLTLSGIICDGLYTTYSFIPFNVGIKLSRLWHM